MTLYFISGGPGFGKSDLIDEFQRRGYLVVPEAARHVGNEDERFKGKQIHEIKDAGLMQDFQDEVYKRQRETLENAITTQPVFCDRGFPDSVAYYRHHNLKIPRELLALASSFRRHSQTFILEPLDNNEKDSLRTEDYEERMEIHNEILRAYHEFRYPITRVQKMSIKERANFILGRI